MAIHEILLLLFLLTFSLFIFSLVKRVRGYGSRVNLAKLVIYEFNEAKRGGVGYMHFSIVAGIVLSLLLALSGGALALWIIATPIMFGLSWAAVYRVGVFIRSSKIHRRLEWEKFGRESTKLQIVLLSIILLTLLDIFLSIFDFALSLSIGIVRNLLLALFYVKPAANLLANFEREIWDFKTPFVLRDVLEGKIDAAEVKFGYSKVEDVERDVLFSCQSCGEIGACDAVCPAVAVGRHLSPRVVVRTVALGSLAGLESQAWACVTCGACLYECPVRVNHLDVIYGVRRAAVAEGRVDKKIGDVLLSASQYGNTLSTPNVDRHNWLRELGVRHASEGVEYLLWVGCLGSFDWRSREIVKAFVEVLKRAGVLDKVAVLGDEETCCGDPLRRLGEESRFQEFVIQNGELFKKYGVKKIITICPHGYNVFKNDYRKLGVELEVYHHVQFLQKLVEERRLALRKSDVLYTIHDPCYLARYNGVVKPQREIISRLGRLREPPRRGAGTFCCGAGGGNYWYDVPEEKRISHVRLEQLSTTGASTVVTLCPFCNAMLSDAARTRGVKIGIRDVAEVVLEHST